MIQQFGCVSECDPEIYFLLFVFAFAYSQTFMILRTGRKMESNVENSVEVEETTLEGGARIISKGSIMYCRNWSYCC